MGSYLLYYMTGIIMIPVFIFALICQAKVKSNYRKYSKIMNRRGMTGAQAAYQLLMQNGITDVSINRVAGDLTDNYDPRSKSINLSQGVFDSTSVAAIGIACHEAGHACQHAQEYSPLKLRNAVIPATRIGSSFGVILCIGGIYLTTLAALSELGMIIAYAGIILYSFVVLFQLITLPVEFDASKRALATIKSSNFLDEDEYKGAKKVLTAAALTYVAALASALATLLRLLIIVSGGSRRR